MECAMFSEKNGSEKAWMWSSLSCTEVRASRHCFDVALERCKHTPGERRVSFSRTRGCSGTEEGEAELWSCAVGWGLSWAGWCGGERCHPHGVPPPTWAWEAFLLHPFQLAVGGVQLQHHLLRRCERTEGFFHVLFPDRREGEKKKRNLCMFQCQSVQLTEIIAKPHVAAVGVLIYTCTETWNNYYSLFFSVLMQQ